MSDHLEPTVVDLNDQTPAESMHNDAPESPRLDTSAAPVVPEETTPVPGHTNGTAEAPSGAGSRFATAGRKGAERIHQLIQRGELYEKEHGLKRGRQRLRQLIEEGKLYEQEHGLSPVRPKKRGSRLSREQLLRRLLETLLRISKRSYRPQLLKLVQALESPAE